MRVPRASRVAWLLLLAGVALPASSRAQDVAALSGADRDAIAGVITDQIAAFRRDDAAAAFGDAAPSIQALFGDPATFLHMVRRAYAPVYRPRSVQMRDLVTRDGKPVQRVDLVGPDGQASLALYTMEREADGAWRIAGCELTRSDRLTT